MLFEEKYKFSVQLLIISVTQYSVRVQLMQLLGTYIIKL